MCGTPRKKLTSTPAPVAHPVPVPIAVCATPFILYNSSEITVSSFQSDLYPFQNLLTLWIISTKWIPSSCFDFGQTIRPKQRLYPYPYHAHNVARSSPIPVALRTVVDVNFFMTCTVRIVVLAWTYVQYTLYGDCKLWGPCEYLGGSLTANFIIVSRPKRCQFAWSSVNPTLRILGT